MFTHQSCLLIQVFLWITLNQRKPVEPEMDLQLVRSQVIQLATQFLDGVPLQSIHNPGSSLS
jgi:hypothetical protein